MRAQVGEVIAFVALDVPPGAHQAAGASAMDEEVGLRFDGRTVG